MSNEPENRVEDTLVSTAYRKLARERAPDHLNESVLKMAADSRTQYARARAWMRPAAWAATIGLSLAIVLELTQLPSTDSDYRSLAPSADGEAPEAGNTKSDDSAARVPIDAPASPSTAPLGPVNSRTDAESKQRASPSTTSPDTQFREEFVPRNTTAVRDAEELARAQTGANQGAAATVAETEDAPGEGVSTKRMSAEAAAMRRDEADRLTPDKIAVEARGAAASLAAISDADLSGEDCPPSERKTAAAWLACIGQLRKDGHEDRADGEYEEFRQVFPEFDDSITD